MQHKIILGLLVIALMATSCVSKIDLKTPATSVGEITVVAKITNGPVQKIEIDSYKVYDQSGDSYDRVNSSSAYIENEDGKSVEIPLTNGGHNELEMNASTMEAIPGEKYRIRVTFREIGEIVSDWETIPEPVERINYDVKSELVQEYKKSSNTYVDVQKIMVDLKEVKFPSNATLKGFKYKPSYVFKYKNNESRFQNQYPFCYLYESDPKASGVNLFLKNGDSFNDKLTILETNSDFRFEYGCYIFLEHETLSESGYDYFDQIKQLNPEGGSLFQRKAGNIQSNFTTQEGVYVHGFFYAVSPGSSKVYVSPEVAKVPQSLCPLVEPPPMYDYPQTLCDNCLYESFSTGNKPAFWVD